jgi:iron(III) transport system permease protein
VTTTPAGGRRLLLVLSAGVVALLLLPLAFLVWQASVVGWSTVWHLLFRGLALTLLWNTVRLVVVVTVLCAAIGMATAWCVERTRLPGRRVLAVLFVLPLAVPDFVIAFGWSTLDHGVHGYFGAVLVMVVGLYPLVHLPVAASLRSTDPAVEEVARSLGLGRLETFFRVTLAGCRLAVLGGCLLVALVTLSEYGAFETLGFQTFTTEIYTEFQVGLSSATACALSLVLVAVCLVLLAGEAAARGSGALARRGAHTSRLTVRRPLGRATVPVLLGCAALVTAALGVPVGMVVYWMARGGSSGLPPASILDATWHTAWYSAAAALVATVAALPVALMSVRRPGRLAFLLERSSYIVMALPGLVIALAFSFFAVHDVPFLYQTPELLVLAYAVLFFPLALVCVRASAARTSERLEEVGRGLGRPPWSVLLRVTLPMLAPGLAAAFCLVFVLAVTQLTPTLVLIPTNQETLATQFWAYESYISYGAAAPYAAVMILIAAAPAFALARWFDRLPAKARGAH